MPTYEYVCPDGHSFDKFFRKMSDSVSELPCTVCDKVATRQISGGIGLLFKGSGFYITDYGKDGKKGMSPPASHPHAAHGGSATHVVEHGGAGSNGAGESSTRSSPAESGRAPAAKVSKTE